MPGLVLMSIQHEKGEESARETDTQLSKEKNNISYNIHFPYPKDVTDDQISCNL